jgi:hypothetical protein
MNQLEIIHVRLAVGFPDDLVMRIRESISGKSFGARVSLFRHVGVMTDLAVHYAQDVSDSPGRPSPFALRLASDLREYGMVEHSVWINDECRPNDESGK